MKTIEESNEKQEAMSQEDRNIWVLYGAFWGVIAILGMALIAYIWQSLFSPQSIKVSTGEAIGTAFIFAIPCGSLFGGYMGYEVAAMPKEERKKYLIMIFAVLLLSGLFRYVLSLFITEPKSGEVSLSALLWEVGPFVAGFSTASWLLSRVRRWKAGEVVASNASSR